MRLPYLGISAAALLLPQWPDGLLQPTTLIEQLHCGWLSSKVHRHFGGCKVRDSLLQAVKHGLDRRERVMVRR